MSCSICEGLSIGDSEERPFTGFGNTYQCQHCKQNWWCYNTSFLLWTRVNDPFTWEVVKRDCPVEVNISDPAEVMGVPKESRILPLSTIAWPNVLYPKFGLDKMTKGAEEETLHVQWIGDYEKGNMLGLQFKFLLAMDMEKEGLTEIPMWSFLIGYLGPVENWMNKDQIPGLISNFGSEEAFICYVLSSEKSCDYGGRIGPFAAVFSVVPIRDSDVGIITPRSYYNQENIETVMYAFEKKA